MTAATTMNANHVRDPRMTSLGDGTPVQKNSPYITAMGGVEELNAQLGLLASVNTDPELRAVLLAVQTNLMQLHAELWVPGSAGLPASAAESLGKVIEQLGAPLPPFDRAAVLPGGSQMAAACHVARSRCRTLERDIVALQDIDPGALPTAVPYLDCVSDLLLVVAQGLNRRAGIVETRFLVEPRARRQGGPDGC